MTPLLWFGVAGTVVFWLVSAVVACALGAVLVSGSLSGCRMVRWVARGAIHVSRGIPTSLLVLVAGIGMFRASVSIPLPVVFPHTDPAFQHLAWALAVALAVGSAGHLAEIFLGARSALGPARLQQIEVMGLPRLARGRLVAREAAPVAMAPVGSRLVHHLHNTAFAGLFPVTELFGTVQSEMSATFRATHFAVLGCGVYIALSVVIWALFRSAEEFAQPSTRAQPQLVAA